MSVAISWDNKMQLAKCDIMVGFPISSHIYSLVNGLFKISTESLKLVLDAEQSGASSDLIVPTCDVQKVSFFSFFYASSLRHSMDSTEILSSTFQPTFHHKV